MTAAEFARLEPQPCPVCGTTVDVEQVDVTPNPMYEALHGRLYIAGRWACPRDCDPETGRRYHGRFTLHGDHMTAIYACSCGGEVRVHNQAEHDQFFADHPIGQWR